MPHIPLDTRGPAPVAPLAASQDKFICAPANVKPFPSELPEALLDAIAGNINQIDGLDTPLMICCGNQFIVFARAEGRSNRYGWTRHDSEDQARFFFACAPGSIMPVDDIAAKNIYLAEGSRTNG